MPRLRIAVALHLHCEHFRAGTSGPQGNGIQEAALPKWDESIVELALPHWQSSPVVVGDRF
jgi:hypothetical protein